MHRKGYYVLVMVGVLTFIGLGTSMVNDSVIFCDGG